MEVSRGKVPNDINGVYLRNGPNALYEAGNGRGHFFDGDAMIHALRIKDGKSVSSGFTYNSATNEEWMTRHELQIWLKANQQKLGKI